MLNQFDPYDQLQAVMQRTQQLIQLHNQHDELLLTAAQQHTQLIGIVRHQQQQIHALQAQLNRITRS